MSLLSISTYCFNWEECKRSIHKSEYNYFWTYGFTTSIYGTSEFLTSTGECAMIGIVEHDKKVFIAHNKDHLKNDISRGEGEYLTAYSKLSSCNEVGKSFLPKVLRSSFVEVFGTDGTKSNQEVYQSLEKIIHANKTTNKNCNLYES
tara:strand:- start:37034 stop:37474 length:441 start_codon:yes stop_codon:yes gene_type:complete